MSNIHYTLQDHLLLWKYLYFIISSYYQRKRVYCKYWVIATFTFYLLGKLHNIGTITQYNIKFYCSFLESSFFTKMQSGNIKFRPILLIYITKIFIYFDLIQCSMKIYYHIFYFSEKSLSVNLNLKNISILDQLSTHIVGIIFEIDQKSRFRLERLTPLWMKSQILWFWPVFLT